MIILIEVLRVLALGYVLNLLRIDELQTYMFYQEVPIKAIPPKRKPIFGSYSLGVKCSKCHVHMRLYEKAKMYICPMCDSQLTKEFVDANNPIP